jgi:glycosyltransferase involved in cell wall biosynthesis
MSISSPPLISVIVATFNCAKTFQQCIDSVAIQTYPHKELIIIDGGSEDGTAELLAQNNDKISYWVSEPDRGVYSAWNKGLAKAKGEWICFLGADDYFWGPQVLEHMARRLEKIPENIRVAYGQIMLLSEGGKNLYPVGEPWEKARKCFDQLMSIPHPGAMHRRILFEQRGPFDESFRIGGDYEMLLRELKTGDAVFIPDLITAGMRQGGISSDPAKSLAAVLENRRAQRIHGQRFPGWLWIATMIKVYMRLLLWRLLGESSARKILDMQRRVMGLSPYWTKG